MSVSVQLVRASILSLPRYIAFEVPHISLWNHVRFQRSGAVWYRTSFKSDLRQIFDS